ncbi:MAG TPA: small basic family protein [Capsulimonadaceae bacterium]|jgi:small basic protein
MGWIAFFAGVAGFVIVYLPSFKVPPQYGPYLSVAVMAGLDAIVGGARAIQEGGFKSNVFLSGFILTVFIAVVLSGFGDAINVPIWYATVFVFTWRILNNVSFMRRYWLEHEQIHIPQLPHLPRPKRPNGVSTASPPSPDA